MYHKVILSFSLFLLLSTSREWRIPHIQSEFYSSYIGTKPYDSNNLSVAKLSDKRFEKAIGYQEPTEPHPILFSTPLPKLREAVDMAVDEQGTIYLLGKTDPNLLDNIENVTHLNRTDNFQSLYVAKLSPDGQLEHVILFGGRDFPVALEVGNDGVVYITGMDYSGNYPVTAGGMNRRVNNGSSIFVTAIDMETPNMLYSILLGPGTSRDIAVDDFGAAYIVGDTSDIRFQATNGAFQTEGPSYSTFQKIIVAKVNNNGQLIYATYLGAIEEWNQNQLGKAIIVDEEGAALITGHAEISGDNPFPSTQGTYSQIMNGISDIFVAKFNPLGTDLVFSTFLGGGGYSEEEGQQIFLDRNGLIMVASKSSADDFPTTNPSIEGFDSGNQTQSFYISQFDEAGTSLISSVQINGQYSAMDMDANGNVFLGGTFLQRVLGDLPITDAAHQGITSEDENSTDLTAYLLQLDFSDPMHPTVGYASSFNGSQSDHLIDIEVDNAGNLILLGSTDSTDLPLLAPPFANGQTGVFVTKFDFGEPDPIPNFVSSEEEVTNDTVGLSTNPSIPSPTPTKIEPTKIIPTETDETKPGLQETPDANVEAIAQTDASDPGENVQVREPEQPVTGDSNSISYLMLGVIIFLFAVFIWWLVHPNSKRVCTECGQSNKIDASFCMKCGTTLSDPVMERPKWPGILLGIALLISSITFFWLIFGQNKQPETNDTTNVIGDSIATPTIDETPVVTETVAVKATNIIAPTNISLPKPTETATQTPVPSPTEFPTQTPEPVYITDLQPLSLGSGANGSLDFQLPTGEVRLGGIPFQLDGGVFKSQASVAPHNLAPDRIIIETSLSMPTRLFLLLNTGNGFNRFSDQVIGEVNVSCQGIPYSVKELRLGEDVREWHSAANVVSTTTNSMQVWPENGTSNLGQIDLIVIALPEECEESNLDYIEVVDTSVETTGSMDPALNLIGVTVEQLVLVEQQDQEAKPTNFIAYVNLDGQVVVEDLNGDFSQIVSTKTTRDPGSIQLKWAPYGEYLAIFRKNPYTAEIFTFHEENLIEFETGEWIGFGWDPNVRGITYMTYSGEKWAIDLAKNLHVKYGTTITPPYEGDRVARFEPSPEMELAALNFRGGQVGFLTPPGNLYLTNDLETYEDFLIWFGNYSWSSDSRYLAGDEMDLPCYVGDINILDTQTGEIIVLPKDVEVSDQFPLWSPNGRYLAIASSPKEDPQNCAENDIWIVDMDDMSRKQLTFDMFARPMSWSPDGKSLMIKTVDNLLKIVDVDSGKVTDFSSGFNAQWHP